MKNIAGCLDLANIDQEEYFSLSKGFKESSTCGLGIILMFGLLVTHAYALFYHRRLRLLASTAIHSWRPMYS